MTVLLGSDSFVRANQAGWGLSSGGITWSGDTSFSSIASNEGLFSTATPPQFPVQTYGASTYTDAEVLVRCAFSGASGILIDLRVIDANNRYRLQVLPTSALHIVSKVAGVTTNLTTVSIALTANSFYWFRFRVVGSNLYAKYWADGSGEPAAWTSIATDTNISSPGKFAISGSLTDTSTVKVDNLSLFQAYNIKTLTIDTFMIHSPGRLTATTGVKFSINAVLLADWFKLVFTSPAALIRLSFSNALPIVFKFGDPPLANPNSSIQVSVTAMNSQNVALANLSSLTCVVTFPDGSVSPTYSIGSGIVNSGGGVYVLSYTTKSPGINSELWTATDTLGNTAQYQNRTSVTY